MPKPSSAAKMFTTPDQSFAWTPGGDPTTDRARARFFQSPPLEELKRTICEIGRRVWQREYVDGNGGNITVRVGDNLVLCTPTQISKGFMQPEDLCLIDLDGRQFEGRRQRTSEALTHLGIMRRQPLARACIHAHPPHATAFALTQPPPAAMLTEAEIFLGVIGRAGYRTPGTPENAEEVGRVGARHQATLMANHGVIVWGKAVEDAYWRLEIIDAYCRTLWIALQTGSPLRPIPDEGMRALIAIRKAHQMPDDRAC